MDVGSLFFLLFFLNRPSAGLGYPIFSLPITAIFRTILKKKSRIHSLYFELGV